MNVDKIDRQELHDFNQIVYILLILITKLSKYHRDDISNFNECIEGYIELHFSREFLVKFNKKYGITEEIIVDLEDLMKRVTALYDSGWMKKLQESSTEVEQIRTIASRVLLRLGIEYVEPAKFSDENLNYDWLFSSTVMSSAKRS